MESLRSRGELAFSWCLSGAGVIGSPLIGLARASGEIGVGAGFAFLAASAAAVWHARRGELPGARPRRFLFAATCLVWLFLGAGYFIRPAGPALPADTVDEITVASAQADVALAVKWVDAHIDSTKIPYQDLTRRAADQGAEFVVWAETSVPKYVRYDQDLLGWMRNVVQESRVWLYAGFPDADRSAEGKVLTYNSSGLFSPAGLLEDKYAKYHLLPIGESMPFSRYLPFLADIDVGQAEWTPGGKPHPMMVALDRGTFRFSGLVCFESIFSRLGRMSVRAGSQCLVVITNDGWFGESAGPRQHTWLARMRAVECGVPVIRCANNGISFICDADGRYLAWLGLGQRGVARAVISPGRGDTLYVAWGTGPLFGFLSVWSLLVGGWLLCPPGKRAGP